MRVSTSGATTDVGDGHREGDGAEHCGAAGAVSKEEAVVVAWKVLMASGAGCLWPRSDDDARRAGMDGRWTTENDTEQQM